MDGGARPPKLNARISPISRLGRSISPPVLEAAEEIVSRAVEHAEHLLVDPAIAATLLEDAAAAVSRALRPELGPKSQHVRDLPCYLFSAFIRRVSRVKRQQLIAEAALVSHFTAAPSSINPTAEIEIHILIDELLARCDSKTRDMFYRRIQGFSWKQIGTSYGMSAHAAEKRFGKAIRRIAKRLGSKMTDKLSDED
jgi:DNA-directed RNA polymerase specialized sigma24 family protein